MRKTLRVPQRAGGCWVESDSDLWKGPVEKPLWYLKGGRSISWVCLACAHRAVCHHCQLFSWPVDFVITCSARLASHKHKHTTQTEAGRLANTNTVETNPGPITKDHVLLLQKRWWRCRIYSDTDTNTTLPTFFYKAVYNKEIWPQTCCLSSIYHAFLTDTICHYYSFKPHIFKSCWR